MKTTWAAVGLACIALAGCNKPSSADSASAASDLTAAADSNAPIAASQATSDNMPPSSMPGGNPASAAATQGSQMTATDFVQNAAVSDMFEIASSKVALQRSHNPDIKAFAHMMITDHTKTTAGLKAAIARSGQNVSPPADLPGDKQAMLQDLQNAPASDFDKKYMDDQVAGHQSALDLMSRYANDGTIPALQAAAKKTGPLVQMHLDKAKALRQSLG